MNVFRGLFPPLITPFHAVGPVRRPMLPLTEEVDALVKQVVSQMSFT